MVRDIILGIALTFAVIAIFLLIGCVPTQVTQVTDQQIYPMLRSSSCALAEPLRDARQVERYEASGLYVDADCSWYPGKTFDQYLAEKANADLGN